MRILIYSDTVSHRLKYACTVVFKCILQVDFMFTDRQKVFTEFDGVKINYSHHDLPGIHVKPDKLVLSRGLQEVIPGASTWDDMPVLYHNNPGERCPFDIFSAVFFMCSRYEEYLPFIADSNGRFGAEQSVAYQHNFLHRPVVDILAYRFAEIIQSVYPLWTPTKREYKYLSTIDIDSAYAYKHKGLMRSLGVFIKDLSAADMDNLKRRMKTIMGSMPDPFDTYDTMLEWHKELGVECVVFFLLADYGMNDKNVPYSSRKYKSLIKRIGDYHLTGIHPGYMSNFETGRIDYEIFRLNKATLRPVTRSRQHFLMLRMPQTYRTLISKGITDDYTMGFASHPGFRLGTCTTIPFYDLEYESMTKLNLHPFAVMDATLNLYMKLSPEQAMEQCTALINEVKAVDGQMISLWHNESLSEMWHWKGWLPVYRHVLEEGMRK